MKNKSCIYCGITKNLSKSDIIPDALTNTKIINPNVCSIAHNSNFSDLFESYVIQKLAFIANELDVKSSKGKRFPKYNATIIVNGDEYVATIASDAELFRGGKLLSSKDGKAKIGSIEQIRKIKNATPDSISEININEIGIEKRIPLDLSVFFSDSMYRLISKIAFEWYCLCNNVSEKIEAFNGIIDYITTGNSKNPVRFVSNSELYELLDNFADFGSHVLLSYIGVDGSVNIIVSLFGLSIYNVRLLDFPINLCEYNVNFIKLSLDSKRSEFKFKTLDDLILNLSTSFEDQNIGGFMVKMPKNFKDTSLNYQLIYSSYYTYFQNDLKCISEPDKTSIDFVLKNILKVTNTSALTVKALKRFVNDHKEILSGTKGLNPKSNNGKTLFLFYILFIIGKSDGRIKGIQDLVPYMSLTPSIDKIRINNDTVERIKKEMFDTIDYLEIIKKGFSIVEKWD